MFKLPKKKFKDKQITNIGAENDKPDAPKPYFLYEFGKARYEIEHRVMRDWFFRDPTAFIIAMIAEDGVYKVYDSYLKRLNITNPYMIGEFKASGFKFNSDNLLVRIELPIPEYVPLCYRIYVIVDPKFEQGAYYTIEKGNEGGFVCEWRGKVHSNLQKIKMLKSDGKEKNLFLEGETQFIINEYNKNVTKQL